MTSFLQIMYGKKKIFFFAVFVLALFPFVVGAFDFFDLDKILVWFGNQLFLLSSVVLFVSSFVFDNMLAITLSTDLLNQPFVKVAWTNIRDIAYITFILGVLYIAFSMLMNKQGWERSLVYLVIIIFIINFSLFFSRVIVDAGNITAHVFMSAMSITIDNPEAYFAPAAPFYKQPDMSKFKSVGAVINNSIRPDKMLGIENFNLWIGDVVKSNSGGMFLILSIFTLLVSLMLARYLLAGAFMFMGRLVWILYYMVSSPLWFVTFFIPGQERLLIDKWLIPFLSRSFCIVVYLMFIWGMVLIIQADMLGSIAEGSNLTFTIAIFFIKAVFIAAMMKMGNELGGKMCEGDKSTFGMVAKFASAAIPRVPLVGGAARNVTGLVGKTLQGSKTTQKLLTQSGLKGWVGDKLYNSGRGLMDAKVQGKSYAEDQNTRMEKMKQSENSLPKDLARERKVNRLGIGTGEYDEKGNQKIDESKIEDMVDVDFKKYQKLSKSEEPLTPEQQEEYEELKKGVEKALTSGGPEKIIFKKGVEGEYSGGIMSRLGTAMGDVASVFSPQAKASLNRISEDRESKKEMADENRKKEEQEKKSKQASKQARELSSTLSTDIDNVYKDIQTGTGNLDSLLSVLTDIKDDEKEKFEKLETKMRAVESAKEREEKAQEFMRIGAQELGKTSKKEKKLLEEFLQSAVDDGLVTLDDANKVFELDSGGRFNMASVKDIVDKRSVVNKEQRVKDDIVDQDAVSLMKETKRIGEQYSKRREKAIKTDEAYVKADVQQEIATINKKIQGIKADQEKADVRKRTVAAEQKS